MAKLRAVMCVKVEPCAPNASAARRGCPHESTPVEMLKPHGREGGCGMAGGGRRSTWRGRELDINQPGSAAGTSAALIMDEIKDRSAAQTEER